MGVKHLLPLILDPCPMFSSIICSSPLALECIDALRSFDVDNLNIGLGSPYLFNLIESETGDYLEDGFKSYILYFIQPSRADFCVKDAL